MPDPITRIIIRRGLESERSGVVLLQSEPGYATDSKRLYIGDGTTAGGTPVGARFLGYVAFGPVFSNVSSALAPTSGDFVYDTASNILYALTGADHTQTNNYRNLGIQKFADDITIKDVSNIFSVKQDSLDATYLTTAAVGTGLTRESSNSVLRVAQPSAELSFSGNSLQITDGGVANVKLATMSPNTIKGRLTTAGAPQDVPVTQIISVDNSTLQKSAAAIPVLSIKDGGVTNAKLASMPANTVKGRLNSAGVPQDIPISEIQNDLYFSMDIRGLSVPGTGAASVVGILNVLAPPTLFPPGRRAYIAGTQQSFYSVPVYSRSIGRTVLTGYSSGVSDPARSTPLIYKVNANQTSWEYVSG